MSTYSKLSEFIAFVKDNGFLVSSHFNVIIGGPPSGEINTRDVMMLCESTNLPGLNIFTNELRIFGESRHAAYSMSYSDISMTFLVDRDMKVRQYFEDWTNQIFNRSTRELGYYNDFVKNIEIYVTDKEGKVVHGVKLYECYPKTIGDVPLDYNSKDIIRLPVTFHYKYWENIYAGNFDNRKNTVYNLTGTGPNMDRDVLSEFLEASGNAPNESNSATYRLVGSIYTPIGVSISSELPRLSDTASITAGISSLPASISTSMKNLGSFTNNLGNGIADLGRSINQFTAPVSAIGNAVGGVASTLNQFNSTLNSLGIGTPFDSAINKLNGLSGQISTISSLGGVPSQISSLGATMTGVGGTFNQVAKTMDSIPEATKQFKDSLSKIGSAFSRQGSNLADASSEVQSQIENQP
jgi:hypothetical protein